MSDVTIPIHRMNVKATCSSKAIDRKSRNDPDDVYPLDLRRPRMACGAALPQLLLCKQPWQLPITHKLKAT